MTALDDVVVDAHDLDDEGAPVVQDPGALPWQGRARCSCGDLSPVYASDIDRRVWHRRHAARAARLAGARR